MDYGWIGYAVTGIRSGCDIGLVKFDCPPISKCLTHTSRSRSKQTVLCIPQDIRTSLHSTQINANSVTSNVEIQSVSFRNSQSHALNT